MIRSRLLTCAICFGLVICSTATCMAASHGKRKPGKNRLNDGIPPVDWSSTIAQAAEEAKKDDGLYLIFFCSEDVAGFAGAGSKAVERHSKTVTKMPAPTAFEAANVVDTLEAVGCPIVKIVLSPQTAEVAKKYKVASVPSLVACEPGGTVLCGLYGEVSAANTLEMLKSLKEVHAKWKKANPDKAPAVSTPPAQPEPKKPAPDDGP